MTDTSSWSIEVVEDPDSGDLLLPLPPDLLLSQGWIEGDTLIWKDNADGSWIIIKKHHD